MIQKRYTAILLGLVFGACMPFAFAPYHLIWLAILSLTGLVWLIQSKYPFMTGYSFGFGWFGFGAWWLAPTVHDYGGLAWGIAILVPILMGLVMGLFPALWAWICIKLAHFSGNHAWLLLLLPSTAILMEWLRGHVLTGLPWTSIGNLVLDTPASAWLSVWGVYGMAFLPILLATSLAFLWKKEQRQYAIIAMIACISFIFTAPSIPQPETPESHVALIQPNIPQNQRWDRAFLQQSMQRLVDLSAQQAPHVNLIIWPEAAIPFYLERSPHWNRWLQRHAIDWHTSLLFGALKRFKNTGASQNGLYLLDTHAYHQTGEIQKQFVGKHHLVPFGEYIPSWLPWLRKIGPDIADFQAAQDTGILKDGTTQFGSLICYESLFPEQARARVQAGANVLVVVTNDAWYAHSPAAWQHFQASRARAIENGRYVLRAANTGISAIIAPDGSITHTAPWWTKTTITGTYRTSDIITPYQRWGDMPALFMSILLCVFTVGLGYYKRSKHG